MHLLELTCDDFRCFTSLRFCPGPGLNVIHGANAQGKTSLLESLLYLATSKSHRTHLETDLVRRGETTFRVSGRIARAAREVRIETAWSRGSKRIRINGVNQPRVSDLLGKINVVFFSPEDVDLVRGSASQRRTFLDMELSQLLPTYLYALQQYRDIVRQRNELLRQPKLDEAQLAAWDTQLARHGSTLIRERRAFLDQLAPKVAESYAGIAGGESFSIAYKPDVREEGRLHEALLAARVSDTRQGLTTRGPHRDDIEFVIASKPARAFASQGQQKTAALALKMAELPLVRERIGEYPILMLDDVFAELDLPRSRRLVETIPADVQCLITTTDTHSLRDSRLRDAAHFTVREGTLLDETRG